VNTGTVFLSDDAVVMHRLGRFISHALFGTIQLSCIVRDDAIIMHRLGGCSCHAALGAYT